MPGWFKQKVLITGGSGFLGSHLCDRLYEAGAEVHATSREARSGSNVTWWQHELTDSAGVRELLHAIQPEVIFHLAGHVTAAPDLQFVLPTFQSLLSSTVNMLTVATEMKCRRVVLTGSLTEPEPGQTDAAPGSPYAAAKWAGSAYGRMFQSLYGTPVVITRPFMTYGPRQDRRKVIPYMMLSLLNGEAPKLSSGQWQADWIYVDDVIDGMLAAAHAEGVEGHTVDLGTAALVSIQDVAQRIVKLTGTTLEPQFGALPDRPREQVRIADIARSNALLGWTPSTPLEVGLQRTLDWYRRNRE